MNKVFSLFMICAMAVSLTAADTLFFNRYQFQPALGEFAAGDKTSATKIKDLAAITVPFVYSGNLKLTGYGAADNDWVNYEYDDKDCFVGKNSLNLPIYMTICQPCLDCYPCTVLGQEDGIRVLDNEAKVGKDAAGKKALVGSVTRWNLYVVSKEKDGKDEEVNVYKINLMTTQREVDSVFFTGRKGSGNDSDAFAQYKATSGEATAQFAMIGKKNDYKFKFQYARLIKDGATWKWEVVTDGKTTYTDTAYIKSATKFDGVFCIAKMYGVYVQDPVIYPQFTPAPHAETDYNQITKATKEDTQGLYYGFQFCGEIKLTRNASLTGAAVKGAFGVTKPKAVKNWEDCDEEIPATYCEEYFLVEWGDKMDKYLKDTVYKSYSDGKDEHKEFKNRTGLSVLVAKTLDDYWTEPVEDADK